MPHTPHDIPFQLPLADFLRTLEEEGFDLSFANRMRVQRVLQTLGKEYLDRPDELAQILAPVIAHSPGQQERFYELFGEYMGRLRRKYRTQTRPEEQKRQELIQQVLEPKPWVYWYDVLAIVIGLLFGAIAGYYLYLKPRPPHTYFSISGETELGDTLQLFNQTPELIDSLERSKYYWEWLVDSQVVQRDSVLFYSYVLADTQWHTLGLRVGWKEQDGLDSLFEQKVRGLLPAPEPEYIPPTEEEEPDEAEAPPIPIPGPKPGLAWPAFFLIFIGGLGAYLLAEFVVYARNWAIPDFIIDRFRTRDKGPYSLQFPKPKDIYEEDAAFRNLASAMRQREEGERIELDIGGTVKATVKEAGFPKLVYGRYSVPTQYLALIERRRTSDQQPQVFFSLAEQLGAEDVFVEPFWYDPDLDLVWNDSHPTGLPLESLSHRYADYRLLIYSDGYGLLDDFADRLHPWRYKNLAVWHQRAVMTPVDPADWSYREYLLRGGFLLVPANMSNQLRLVQQADWEVLKAVKWPREDIPVSRFDFTRVDHIWDYLQDEHLFRWLAATAVYPQRLWPVTIAIGQALRPTGLELNYEHLYKLSRIPWFQESEMPEELRRELLTYLDPETERLARQAVLDVLDSIELPDDSFAQRERQVALLEQQVELTAEEEETEFSAVLARKLGLLGGQKEKGDFWKYGWRGRWARLAVGLLVLALLLGVWKVMVISSAKSISGSVDYWTPPEMVFVEGGTFMMGCTAEQEGYCLENEIPDHQVLVSDFSIGKYEVTFEEYDHFCEVTGREKPDDAGWGRGRRPVIDVSWEDATAYAEWLSGETGRRFRLPTEAEWEYAARGGKLSRGYIYSGSDSLELVGWFESNASSTFPVGQRQANELGLYDMSGNVWEWVEDWYVREYYSLLNEGEIAVDPQGPVDGSNRVFRGGCCFNQALLCRVAARGNSRRVRNRDVGFRLAFSFQ